MFCESNLFQLFLCVPFKCLESIMLNTTKLAVLKSQYLHKSSFFAFSSVDAALFLLYNNHFQPTVVSTTAHGTLVCRVSSHPCYRKGHGTGRM